MPKKKAKAYSHPATVILVDDDEQFLENLKLLPKDKMTYKAFSNPIKAHKYLTEEYKPNDLIQRCVSQESDQDLNARDVRVNIKPIRDAMYNPERFGYATVLVVDHDMPDMSGIEFCRKLKDFPIKKILLTGVATDKQAIEAFNEGVIDAFINKNEKGMKDFLRDKITELHNERQQEEGAIIIENLVFHREGYEPSCLNDQLFLDLFDKIVEENNICEYYLSEEDGNYVFLDANGKPSWLVIKVKDGMLTDLFMAEDDSPTEDPASGEVIQGIKDFKLIVHIFNEDEWRNDASAWQEKGFVHPAKILKGTAETYYYAYIDDPDTHELDKDRLLSFSAYKKKLADDNG